MKRTKTHAFVVYILKNRNKNYLKVVPDTKLGYMCMNIQRYMMAAGILLSFVFSSFAGEPTSWISEYSFSVDGLYYNILNNKEVEVTYMRRSNDSYCSFKDYNFDRDLEVCNIPESVTYNNHTYSVVRIGYAAFCEYFALTSVTIPNSVTTIQQGAFANCDKLKSITMPSSVVNISQYIFYLNTCHGCMFGEECLSNLTDIYVPCGELERFRQMIPSNYQSCVKYISNSPITVTLHAENGTAENLHEECDPIALLSATPNTGYHFTQWSDGDTFNPRTVQLTQDTSFTAEFAKNTYTITTASNNLEYGYTYGDKTAEYMESVELTAVPQIGHHFEYWQCGSNYYTNNPVTVVVLEDATYTALFGIDTYYLTVNADPSQGYVTAPTQAEFLKEVKMTATALNGYVFTKWSDGETSNPRTVQLTQDTTFTAEFAKAKYTISTVLNDNARGTTSGDAEVEYLTSLKLIATANYGYHFDHWQSGTKTYTANPLNITATGNATYTAYFTPNTYNISVYSNNQKQGSVSAPTQANYLNTITLTATPADGCHFVQWSDGNTTNPRYIQITQDTTFTADFAITTSGLCGDNLTWSYRSNKLTIGGSGAMYSYTATTAPWHLLVNGIYTVVIPEGLTEISSNAFNSCQNLTSVIWNAVNCAAPSSEADAPFYTIRTKIRSFAFGESVKKVPAYLCYEMSAINSITLGSNVTNIGKHAFESCEDLASITCEASIPPTCGTDAFTGVSIFIPVHVPHLSVDKYAKAPIWKEFDAFSSIQAENKSVEEVTATATENSVTMEWPADEDAEIYTIVIERNGVKFCELSFNANGQLLGISFAPSRNGALYTQAAVQTATGWQFTITSLESGTTYNYSVTAKKEDETPLYTKSGSFKTIGTATSLDQTSQEPIANSQKLIKDGQILILRGDKTYTLQGQEVR